jgi:hypothetical protein
LILKTENENNLTGFAGFYNIQIIACFLFTCHILNADKFRFTVWLIFFQQHSDYFLQVFSEFVEARPWECAPGKPGM